MLNINNSQISGEPGLSQQEQLLNFCDEFTEFNDCCAFFCHSVSLIASASDSSLMDRETSQGLKRYATYLKDKSKCLHSWLQQIQAMTEEQKP